MSNYATEYLDQLQQQKQNIMQLITGLTRTNLSATRHY